MVSDCVGKRRGERNVGLKRNVTEVCSLCLLSFHNILLPSLSNIHSPFPTRESVSSTLYETLSFRHALRVGSLHGRPLGHALVPRPEVRVLLLDVVLLAVDSTQNLGVQGDRVPRDEGKISVYRWKVS